MDGKKFKKIYNPKTDNYIIKEVKSKHDLKVYNYKNDPYFCMKCVNGHPRGIHRCYHYAVMKELKQLYKAII